MVRDVERRQQMAALRATLRATLLATLLAALSLAGAASCSPDRDATPADRFDDPQQRARIEAVVDSALLRFAAVADSVDQLLQPVPLLSPQQESAMRRFGNAEHLQRARALGVTVTAASPVEALVAADRLVEIEDSTELWIVRRLTHSAAYVTPDAYILLRRIGTRFQQKMSELGLPAYRLEVTSVLRTPEDQARLRTTNANAAAGESAHQYGTTLDIAYNSYAAPAEPDPEVDVAGAEWLQSRLERIGAAMLETAAARKSRELQAILGAVMIELQSAGDVMVTLERQQPVYHFTLARPQAER
ncbi:hypothetical protein BH23GEM10_BH23GEM10_02440 [soil metagenome]